MAEWFSGSSLGIGGDAGLAGTTNGVNGRRWTSMFFELRCSDADASDPEPDTGESGCEPLLCSVSASCSHESGLS